MKIMYENSLHENNATELNYFKPSGQSVDLSCVGGRAMWIRHSSHPPSCGVPSSWRGRGMCDMSQEGEAELALWE